MKRTFANKKKDIPDLPTNEMITYEKVRLIDETGNQIGIVSSTEARKLASEKNLDLVEIAPQARPPVCKIIDYGKYRYELQKKEKELKKKQHTVSVKTIRIKSVNIDDHDIEIKTKKAREFLEEGNKLKVVLQFRGREIVHKEMGLELLKTFFGYVEDIAKIDKNIEQEGFRRISMILTKK